MFAPEVFKEWDGDWDVIAVGIFDMFWLVTVGVDTENDELLEFFEDGGIGQLDGKWEVVDGFLRFYLCG